MSAAASAPDLTPPSRSGRLLALVRKLVDYGTQLVDKIRARPADADPIDLRCTFFTTDIALILARIKQGLLRAGLLQHKIARVAPRLDAAPQPNPAPSPHTPRALPCEARPPSPPRTQVAVAASNPALANLPTAEEIAAKVRSQPIGAVLADICRDLGLYPAHPLWRELGLAIEEFGGSWLRLGMDRLNQAFPIAHIVARLKAERAAERAAKSTVPRIRPPPPLAGGG
jgi:hypothetical protein